MAERRRCDPGYWRNEGSPSSRPRAKRSDSRASSDRAGIPLAAGHWQPGRSKSKIAVTTSRRSVLRGRPKDRAQGRASSTQRPFFIRHITCSAARLALRTSCGSFQSIACASGICRPESQSPETTHFFSEVVLTTDHPPAPRRRRDQRPRTPEVLREIRNDQHRRSPSTPVGMTYLAA